MISIQSDENLQRDGEADAFHVYVTRTHKENTVRQSADDQKKRRCHSVTHFEAAADAAADAAAAAATLSLSTPFSPPFYQT